MERRQVFISYSSTDREAVSAMQRFLEAQGYSVWLDAGSIEGGSDWPVEIVNGIKGCGVFLLAITPNSAASDHVKREVYLAGEEKKTILPVALPPPCQLPDGVRYHVAGLQRIAVDPPLGLEELRQCVHAALARDGDVIAIDVEAIVSRLPDQKIGPFLVREALHAMLHTAIREVPRHLLDILMDAETRYYLDPTLPEHLENALRRLRNHGLLNHDGAWLFTPTRSRRLWSTPMGDLLIELAAVREQRSHRLLRLVHEVCEELAAVVKEPGLVAGLQRIACGTPFDVDSSLRTLRNHGLISYHGLSSTVPYLHEVEPSQFYVTELGDYVLQVHSDLGEATSLGRNE
ncbi:MAG: toll/interleukin-1 receptor domain-containing protein [Verrucomicrobiales bacterium]